MGRPFLAAFDDRQPFAAPKPTHSHRASLRSNHCRESVRNSPVKSQMKDCSLEGAVRLRKINSIARDQARAIVVFDAARNLLINEYKLESLLCGLRRQAQA